MPGRLRPERLTTEALENLRDFLSDKENYL